jgi:serine/threonine-protein kinase
MAPEQAQGKSRAVGPAADIYALGVILYELLTGQPPFRAESAAQTLQQVISQEPSPPSRQSARVPRDLETICLKCLQKDPQRRYATAAELAADLDRFLKHEPIHARPIGRMERGVRWIRRNPTGTTLIITAIALVGLVIGEVVQKWTITTGQRAEKARLTARWESGVQLAQQGRFAEARAILERLGDGGFDDLRQRIDQSRQDLDLVVELEQIRLNRETSAGYLAYYKAQADQEYLRAFEASGLAKLQDSSGNVAARVRKSAVRVAIIAALDDWAVCAVDKTRRDWLLAIARETDDDPKGWSDRIRAPATWDDLAAISQLAERVPVEEQSVSLLLSLGERLRTAGGDATEFLKRVQKEHPADFWANIVMGNALFDTAPVEAAGYYRAALSSQPDAPVAYTALGDALRIQGKQDEANGYYRQALKIDPNYARGHTNLGNFLSDRRQTREAIECFRTAIKVDPNYAWAHLGLANALSAIGQADKALEHYQAFHSLGPAIPHVANILRSDLVRQGRGEEVRRDWKKALDQNPPDHDAWFGYAELCLFLGDDDEYRRAVQGLIRQFGDTSNAFVAEKTARAILLSPPSADELQSAIALADLAVAAKSATPEWVYPYFLFAKGLAEYRQGHFASAISIMDKEARAVMGPCPRLVIAMARHRLGDEVEARAELARTTAAVDWSVDHVRSHDQWIWHVLRREAEALIMQGLPAVP